MKGSDGEASWRSRLLGMGSDSVGTSTGTPNCWANAPRAATSTTLAAALSSLRSSSGMSSALRKKTPPGRSIPVYIEYVWIRRSSRSRSGCS